MSTTVTISPIIGVGLVAVAGVAAVASVAVLMASVLTDDAECKQMLEEARREQRAQRFVSIGLRSFDLSRLAQSAREAQFSVREHKDWVRIDVPGQRDPVWAARTTAGIAIVGGTQTAARVSVANTVSRLTQILASRGSIVTPVASRSTGREVEFVATSSDNKRLQIAVMPSGEAVVDAVNHRGSECEKIASDLAAAMEGTVTSYRRKPEFFGGAGVRVWGKQRA